MWQQFIAWIKAMFGKKPPDEREQSKAQEHESNYQRIDEINFTAIFAGKLSSIAVAESTMDIDGTSARAQLIAETLGRVFEKRAHLTAQILGTGGRVLVPCATQGKIAVDIIGQDRLYITGMHNDRISSAAILAGTHAEDGQIRYYRWVYYELRDGSLTVANRATDAGGKPVALTSVPEWAEITEEYTIANVERMPFVLCKCPADSRRPSALYGVPITYGCEAKIKEIKEHMRIIQREYKLTRPMLGLDHSLWRIKKRPEDGPIGAHIDEVRRTVQDSDDPFIPIQTAYDEGKAPWLVFAPAIRDTAMYNRMERLYEELEKAVGTSKGILTSRETAYATATEIRAANHDTFAIVSAIRDMWERAMDDLAYSVDVLAEYHGLTPAGARGDYEIAFDWDMSLFESSTETFQQYAELHSRGLIGDAELRQWVRGGSLEDNQKEVDELKARGEGTQIDRILTQQGGDG